MTIRERFRAQCGRRYTTYTCELLGEVTLQSLTEGERTEIEYAKYGEDLKLSPKEARKTTARLIRFAVVGEDKTCEFGDGDIEWLAELDASVAEPLREAIQAHCYPGETDTPVEDAKKNLEPSPG